jgi:hypothetical protein
MFGSTHLSEKDSDRQEIEYPQLQEQQSHPREDALPSDDWVKRDYYLGGTGSWAGQQSSSPNNLRVKQSSGENQYPPLIDFTEPTTFTQGGSNQGSGSNRNPTYSFQDFVSGRSGIQQPNGGKHRRKSLSVDNDDGEDNGPARFERVEAAWGVWHSQGRIFACPFNKHDPAYYSTSCRMEKSISNVRLVLGGISLVSSEFSSRPSLERLSTKHIPREHLLRVHEGPLRCCVCGLVFSNSQKDTLTVLESTCRDLQLLSPLRGMTPDMKIRIRNRYKHGRLTAEQKWFDIYRVLFPDAELPSSPCKPHSMMITSGFALTVNRS